MPFTDTLGSLCSVMLHVQTPELFVVNLEIEWNGKFWKYLRVDLIGLPDRAPEHFDKAIFYS